MNEFDKVIGYESIKKELMQIADVLKNGDEYKKLGVTAPRGLLLYGVPGVGKTLMANAVIKESGRNVVVCRKDKPNGDFVKEIKKKFKEAKEAAPSIILLDDMDKFANGDDRHPDAEEYVTVQSCIDETKGKDVFVLATANNIRVLPGSLYRSGRFDNVIEIKKPRGQDAIDIVDHYIKQKKVCKDIDSESIGRIMSGRSSAELESVINEAGLYAGYERSDMITKEHFMRACLHTIFDVPNEALNGGAPEADLERYDDQLTRVIYHEAGHATVAEVLEPGSVTLISAYSRKYSFGGFTGYYDDGTRNSLEKAEGHICRALGGVAALEQKCGIADNGSGDDFKMAYRTAWDMVTENCIAGFHLHSDGRFKYEEDAGLLKAAQERAVALEVERYYRKTKEIISKNRALFDGIAEALAKKGVLTASDIADIRKTCGIVPAKI